MKQDELIQIRRELHKFPEPGFAETKTQAYLLDLIAQLPQDYLEVETWKTAILVRVTGKEGRKTFGYRTDMDGLPIAEQTGYAFASEHEGYMHACGHDLHMTIAYGLLHYFSHQQPLDHVVFIFQPAEEGPGGALPLLQAEPFNKWRPDTMLALHIAPEYSVGTVATRPGLLFANTSELFIDLEGRGGHAAYPHQANDMVVAASALVTQFQSIVARNVDPLDSAVITVGCIQGGTKQNVIAGTSRLEGTIRTLSLTSMEEVKKRITSMVQGIEASYECKAVIDWGANYKQVYNEESLARDFLEYTDKYSKLQAVECKEAMTGEDFGYFLDEIPGVMFWLGVNSSYGLHDARLNPDEEAMKLAVDHVASYFEYAMNKE
ncbi:N-acetyldiaminopimelate deacetylase [Salsuginibacillus kocurii]|uniref:N-acetyldiaminopimelate deacetylase n=1 Tax=Salsuginibacillus kocurii TaxID=427078 RepID=UPI00036523B2|nr:N-acetyldiaminopimelate deacetylase [Salsuginibacillus kocurii]